MYHLGRHLGAEEEPHPYQSDPRLGFDDPEDGCPGGDQRCRFVRSLLLYGYRRRDQNGNRVENVRFSRCRDDLVIDALNYFEHEEDHCGGYILAAWNKKRQAEHGA